MGKLFANNGDPDQTPHSAASDLGLHCLLITLLFSFLAEKDQTVAEIIDNAEETVVQEGVVDEQSLVTTETALEEVR